MIFNNANIILEDRIILRGSLEIDGEIIKKISPCKIGEGIDLHGLFLSPGFVDEHCHGSGDYWFFEEPEKAAKFHLWHGTTSVLCSMWRNAGTYSYEKAILNVKNAMGRDSNIRGVHMEGPYLDKELGSEGGTEYPVDKEEYTRLLKIGEGVIKQWTFDPTLRGAREFAENVRSKKIRLAVCYSKAEPELLKEYLDGDLLQIASHMLCGSGSGTPVFAGTKEAGSDQFTLVEDRMTAEVIADSMGAHVRPYFLKLIYKCKGADGICLVSDCCAGGETHGSDINVINGELYGSRLTLSVAIKNMKKHTGAALTELVRMASTTPAKAMGFYKERGSIAVGKIADLVVFDGEFNIKGVLLGGKIIRSEY